jgi:arylformamidase
VLIDISPALSEAIPVWPGDTPFDAERTWRLGCDGSPVNVSKLIMSTHTGAHADAPFHYNENGMTIDKAPLEPYIGPCVVLHCLNPEIVTRGLVEKAVLRAGFAERVLIRTYARQPIMWDSSFASVEPQAIHWLADRGSVLIGVDTPSLDAQHSKTMDAHNAIFARDMRVLEGLMLDHAPEGQYELIAPPLKLFGLDASPVRAVLRSLP